MLFASFSFASIELPVVVVGSGALAVSLDHVLIRLHIASTVVDLLGNFSCALSIHNPSFFRLCDALPVRHISLSANALALAHTTSHIAAHCAAWERHTSSHSTHSTHSTSEKVLIIEAHSTKSCSTKSCSSKSCHHAEGILPSWLLLLLLLHSGCLSLLLLSLVTKSHVKSTHSWVHKFIIIISEKITKWIFTSKELVENVICVCKSKFCTTGWETSKALELIKILAATSTTSSTTRV